METSRQEHSATFGEELDLRYLELLKTKAPFEQCKRELLKLENGGSIQKSGLPTSSWTSCPA